jgi:hypothetical protein
VQLAEFVVALLSAVDSMTLSAHQAAQLYSFETSWLTYPARIAGVLAVRRLSCKASMDEENVARVVAALDKFDEGSDSSIANNALWSAKHQLYRRGLPDECFLKAVLKWVHSLPGDTLPNLLDLVTTVFSSGCAEPACISAYISNPEGKPCVVAFLRARRPGLCGIDDDIDIGGFEVRWTPTWPSTPIPVEHGAAVSPPPLLLALNMLKRRHDDGADDDEYHHEPIDVVTVDADRPAGGDEESSLAYALKRNRHV